MAKRNFENFLDAYTDYAADDFCPPSFHKWTGLSIMAAALERKVWTKQALINHYPNIYVLLVSHPGMGKSTALERGVDLIEEVKEKHNPEIKIIPTQITEAALMEMMNIRAQLNVTPTQVVYHSSGYFYASEASASALQNLFGDFNATITSLYDCPKVLRKKIKAVKEVSEINNCCMNLLAGSTFDYLKNLVNSTSVMGGLASRFIYVVNKERIVTEQKWDQREETDFVARRKLIEDLTTINKMQGRFTPSLGWIDAWEKWTPKFKQELNDLNSPRMESIMARKGTNLLKVSMLLSAAEGDTMLLTEKHWHDAQELLDGVTKDNSSIISAAIIADKGSQSGLTQFILEAIEDNGGTMMLSTLKARILRHGSDIYRLRDTLEAMASAEQISIKGEGVQWVELNIDAKDNI